jgi:hypothetical protein
MWITEETQMLPKPVPALTEKQWAVIAQRLEEPAPQSMRKRLKEAVENSKNIKRE